MLAGARRETVELCGFWRSLNQNKAVSDWKLNTHKLSAHFVVHLMHAGLGTVK
jgi:hypothetical protein